MAVEYIYCSYQGRTTGVYIPWIENTEQTNPTFRVVQQFYPTFFATGDLYIRWRFAAWDGTGASLGNCQFRLHINGSGTAVDSTTLTLGAYAAGSVEVRLQATGLGLTEQDQFELFNDPQFQNGGRFRSSYVQVSDEVIP